MSVCDCDFVEWKEESINQERGSRVVHYFLKNSVGESVLAVVGTERSLRHMVYVVSEEFLNFCGPDKSSNNTCFKWRSRREVVDWLTSLLSKQQYSSQDLSKSPTYNSSKSLSGKFSVTGVDKVGTYTNCHKDLFARNLKDHNWDIVWSGAAWSCGKQLKHYQAFYRNGTTISVHSFVLVMAKEENHYLAYLEDMYEDKKGQKKVKVRWFHQSQEVVGKIPPPTPHPREVFITPFAQVISAECVDGLAAVLTSEHFEKCLSSLPYSSSHRTFLCFRQFRNNKIKPFNLSKLRGYFDQSILSCIDLQASGKKRGEGGSSNGSSLKRGTKRSKTCKGFERFTMAHSDVGTLEDGAQIMARGQDHQILRFGFPGRRPLKTKCPSPQCWYPLAFEVGEKIELLCQDSGIRGCWFRCIVLQISRKRLKVKYEDIQNDDGCGNLEEWIPASRPAASDKLGMRCAGRLTVRPCPPHKKLSDGVVEVGTAVDAWWNDGWWEGVVTGIDSSGEDSLQVYFPGEDVFLIAQRRNLRISRDWVGDRWVDIGLKHDILSAISSVSPSTKLSACKLVESGGSAMSERELPTNSGRDSVEDKQALAGLGTTNEVMGNTEQVKSRERQVAAEVSREDNDDKNDNNNNDKNGNNNNNDKNGNNDHGDDNDNGNDHGDVNYNGNDHDNDNDKGSDDDQDDGIERDSIDAQDGHDIDNDVDGEFVSEMDVGSAGQTCEVIAAEA